MSYAATLQGISNSVKAMPVYRVSDKQLARIVRESEAAAVKGLGEELAPAFMAIAKGQPYEKPNTPAKTAAPGSLSGFLAKIGL